MSGTKFPFLSELPLSPSALCPTTTSSFPSEPCLGHLAMFPRVRMHKVADPAAGTSGSLSLESCLFVGLLEASGGREQLQGAPPGAWQGEQGWLSRGAVVTGCHPGTPTIATAGFGWELAGQPLLQPEAEIKKLEIRSKQLGKRIPEQNEKPIIVLLPLSCQ